MIQTNKTREEFQKEALQKFKEHKNLTLEWATGVGKSKVAIDIIKEVFDNERDLWTVFRPFKCLLIVAETAHKDNWEKEFAKWGLVVDITVECYASLKNYQNTEWDLIIFDEAHHAASELRQSFIETIKSKHILLLSATMDPDVIDNLKDIYGDFYISRVGLKTAIDNGILPQPQVYVIPLTLDNTIRDCDVVKTRGNSSKRVVVECSYPEMFKYIKDKTKFPNMELHVKCTQKEAYDIYDKDFKHWKTLYIMSPKPFAKVKWMASGSVRKRFLGSCKVKYVKKLLDILNKKRYICFCSSVEQAKQLQEKSAIYAGKKGSHKLIDDFNNKVIDHLFAVGMLQEGENLVDIDAGIIIQLDGKERMYIQKSGRTLRAKEPLQFIFYFEGTRDEEYLIKILDTIDLRYMKKIEDLDKFEI